MNLFGPEPAFDAQQAVAAVQGTWWTIKHQACAIAAVDAVLNQGLGPSDDEGTLTLYDIVPDVWCAPDRMEATKLIAENIAFAVLDAWMQAVRAEIVKAANPSPEAPGVDGRSE